MHHPQVVVFETDGLLARHLGEITERHRWLVRESRQHPACFNLLRRGGPSVLVVKLGRDLVREMSLVGEVTRELPDVPVVVVNDSGDTRVSELAYDLGTTFVVAPPVSRQWLGSVVEQCMNAVIALLSGRDMSQWARSMEDGDDA
jgi:DNA-binding NtrC family response regulator